LYKFPCSFIPNQNYLDALNYFQKIQEIQAYTMKRNTI
jgi:hypothetical protein